MMAYAGKTKVPIDRTESEIKTLLKKRGATSYASGEANSIAQIVFEMKGRRILFRAPLPMRKDFPPGATGEDRWMQAGRSRWRALQFVIKAKLEAADTGIVSFEDEFLAYTMTPDGRTVGEWARTELTRALTDGRPLPPLLGGPRDD